MSASDFIDQCLAAPLAAAQSESARGRRCVGYIGDDIPVELILAADTLPIRLRGIPQSTPQADRYLESSFGPASRSLLEQWLQGDLDFLDAIVFPRSNDTAQRLYYYICELQRRGVRKGPRSLIYDLARVDRDTSRAHTLAATRALAAQLGTQASQLDAALMRLRDRASLARELVGLRIADSAIAGSFAMRAWRSLQLNWTEAFEKQVRESIASAARATYSARLLLAGSTPPDERFHVAIERAGCNVVDEFFDEAPCHGATRWLASGSTTEAIADAYRSARSTAAMWLQSPDVVVDRARNAGASGVVLWLVEQDEGIVWEVPRQIERLERAGLRTLPLTRQIWDSDASSVSIETFARSLKEAP